MTGVWLTLRLGNVNGATVMPLCMVRTKQTLLQRVAAVDCDYYELVTFIAFLTIWWHFLAALLIGVVFGFVYMQLDLDD
ncbi:hypothetical protein JG687_00019591 [Phytophthora cactorum]|uniref:Uncharacterized protein n=1 Tax=Phytophthora cactorum TaxID=29920 RepID=A0A8T1TIT5_9STRA|nr:hypothetical protein JG687_00019591 [Phytophthora cactorum]